jgi:exonuclease III
MHVGWITDAQDAADFYNAESGNTRHTQFTDDQSGIPTQNPGNFVDYSTLSFFVPSPARQAVVVDFLENGLTDPRVAAEEFPFDRPALGSEIATIMTYNVQAPGWTSARADIVADIIRQQNADIVGLQEAGTIQQGDLLSRLGDVYDFATFNTGAGGEPILLKEDVFVILGSGSNRVTPDCNNQGFVNYLVLEHVASAERLIVHNSHFCATVIDFPVGEPTAVERNQAHAVAMVDSIIDNQAVWNAPAIALGDLNASINSDTMQFLLEQTPLPNGAANPIVLNEAWDSAFPGVPYPARIDWILMTDTGFTVLDTAVISDAQTALASDHEPVLTILAIDTTAVRPVGGLDIESPSAPGNLSATAVTDTTVTLSWTAASDNVAVTGYRIYRDGTLLLTSTAQLFSDSGLQPATSYMYSVTALDASGNESLSSEISITTSTAPVIIPPTTSGGGGSVNVWLLLLLGAVSGLRTVRRQLQPKVPVITLLFKDD